MHFIPLHLQPYWSQRYSLSAEQFPEATQAYRYAVSLPLYTQMTGADQERVIRAVTEVLGPGGRSSTERGRILLKRVLDVTISAAVLMLLSPGLLAVAILVVLDSGFPILFKQDRVGLRFRSFQILKLRSMVANSKGAPLTVKGDLRITRLGRLLRTTKIDELPQLWNVIRGDMSLVGPRPEIAEFVELYRARYKQILEVRPGITDLASIRFRNEEEILARSPHPHQHYTKVVLPLKLQLAEDYVRMQCLKLDIQILLQTTAVTVFPRSLLSGYKVKRFNWLEESSKFSAESDG